MARTHPEVSPLHEGEGRRHTPLSAAIGVEAVFGLLAGRWKLLILFHLFGGQVQRFSDLEKRIDGISQKMLAQQLRQLEADGLVERTVYPQVPPKVDYRMTAWGQALCPALDSLLKWTELRDDPQAPPTLDTTMHHHDDEIPIDSRALALLRERGAAHRIHRHAPILGFESARAVLPFDPAGMVKGLAFRLPDGSCAIAALPGADRADYKKIADALGVRRADLRLASPEEIGALLDMVPGGVAPLPVGGARVLLDQAALGTATVYCGTGRNDATLEIALDELLRVSQAHVADLAKR